MAYFAFVPAGPAPVVDDDPFGSLAGSLTVVVAQTWQEFVEAGSAHGGRHFLRCLPSMSHPRALQNRG